MFEMTIQQTYVGITGFTRREQVRGVLDHFEDRGFVSRGTDHVPMIGLLISPRNLDKKWFSSRYPPIGDFNDLIDDAKGRSFLTIHVDEKATSNWVDSLIDLGSMIDMKHVDGIQVNVKHPSISDLKRVSRNFRKKIILQYSTDFLKKNVEDAMNDLREYALIVDFLLIDPSRGAGIQINVKDVTEHYTAIKKSHAINVGFAGGFTPENIGEILERIIADLHTKDFSIDVESGVRTNDQLDIEKAKRYIDAVTVLKERFS